jgi:hypothetical protein
MSAPLFTCGLYLPGHDVHWIQGIQSAKDQMNLPKVGNVVEVRADGIFVVELDGQLSRLWNHDPGRLERLVARNDGRVSYQPRWGLLRTPSSEGDYCFCVARADGPKRKRCPSKQATGTPIDLLRQSGGFSLRLTAPVADTESVSEGDR